MIYMHSFSVCVYVCGGVGISIYIPILQRQQILNTFLYVRTKKMEANFYYYYFFFLFLLHK